MKINPSEILTTLNEIFIEVLEVENLRLTEFSSPDNIPEWDSVNHLILIHTIEEQFKIKFDLDEIINFRTAGDITNFILRKAEG